MQTKIHLKGLSTRVTSEDIQDYFVQFGEIRQAYVVLDGEDKTKSKCFGFVQFYDSKLTIKVLQETHHIFGKKIKCETFLPKEPRRKNQKIFKKSNELEMSLSGSDTLIENELLKLSQEEYETMVPEYSENNSFSGELPIQITMNNNRKKLSYYEDFGSGANSGKVMHQIIDQLFSEEEGRNPNSKSISNGAEYSCNSYGNRENTQQQPSLNKNNNYYNPFSSPFGFYRKGSLNTAVENIHTIESNKNIKNHVGYIGQHLDNIASQHQQCNLHKGCKCEPCKMKDLERIFGFTSLSSKRLIYSHQNQKILQNQTEPIERSYSSGDIAGNISQLMNMQDSSRGLISV